MGLIVLHSGHFSKIFKKLMGTPCSLQWREAGEKERVWVINRSHPIAQGLGPSLRRRSRPRCTASPSPSPSRWRPSSSAGTTAARSSAPGLTFQRGGGRIFYFSPGHEVYPIYHDTNVQTVLRNAVKWAYNPAPAWTDIARAPNVPIDRRRSRSPSKGPRLHAAGEAGLPLGARTMTGS